MVCAGGPARIHQNNETFKKMKNGWRRLGLVEMPKRWQRDGRGWGLVTTAHSKITRLK